MAFANQSNLAGATEFRLNILEAAASIVYVKRFAVFKCAPPTPPPSNGTGQPLPTITVIN